MGINLSSAPVPERRYVADCVSVEVRNRIANLLFGQEKVGGSGALRSLIELKMNPDGIAMFLGVAGSMQGITVDELFAMSRAPVESLRKIEQEPEQTVAFAANMVSASFTTQEACLDFYQASASSMAQAKVTRQIAVDPVVRVELRLALAVALLKELKRVSAELTSAVKEEK
ncbi:hypothetical protein [Paraburkholderia graminis]|uniref:hypothetical protein n=1 Tax=Paraburkholderia graminis TaxID=60548 RepID=UPI0038BC0BCA